MAVCDNTARARQNNMCDSDGAEIKAVVVRGCHIEVQASCAEEKERDKRRCRMGKCSHRLRPEVG